MTINGRKTDEDGKEHLKLINKTWFRISEKLKPIGLLMILMIYTLIGGVIFQHLELKSEKIRLINTYQTLLSQRNYFIDIILNSSNLNTSNLPKIIEFELNSYEIIIQDAVHKGLSVDRINHHKQLDKIDLSSIIVDRWSILHSVFFASTILTTIGYGNVVPVTDWGRIFCIVFAFIGIPLTLIVIADLGKLFAEFVTKIFVKVKEITPPLIIKSSWIPQNITGRSLSVFAGIGLFFIYLSCGAGIFMIWEDDWNFFDGFYFCFITMTTIGFGDLVPKKPKYMLLCSVYILVGLALTGTIIELIRRQYTQSWEKLASLSGPLKEALKKLSYQTGDDLQADLKKILTIITIPNFKNIQKKYSTSSITSRQFNQQIQQAVELILNDISNSNSNLNTCDSSKESTVHIILYESSV